jgi:hypothetical protein
MTGLRDGRDDTIAASRGHAGDPGTALGARHARDGTGPCPEVIPPEPGELP